MCRCSAADIGDIIRDAVGSGKRLPEYVACADPTHIEEAQRQGLLHMTLLQHPEALADRYNLEGTETEGHRAARRSEHLLQLFLYLHVLAAEEPGRASGQSTDRSTDKAASSPHEATWWPVIPHVLPEACQPTAARPRSSAQSTCCYVVRRDLCRGPLRGRCI